MYCITFQDSTYAIKHNEEFYYLYTASTTYNVPERLSTATKITKTTVMKLSFLFH